MKKQAPVLLFLLLISLFLYTVYRTEKTIVNQLLIATISRNNYLHFKALVTAALPLPEYIIYSLPEGLWVFCITLTSSYYYIQRKQRKWSLSLLPMFLAISMELLQLFRISNGRFDWMDINFATAGWLLAIFFTRKEIYQEPFMPSFRFNSLCCMGSYLLVFLAHVPY